MVITSTRNPRVKQAAALRERRERERQDRTLVEGHDELTVALAGGLRPQVLFYSPVLFREGDGEGLLRRIRSLGAEMVEVSPAVFATMAYRENPDGWLAVFPRLHRALSDLQLGPAPLILAAESIEKPGNLGAMLRTADAAGLDAVVAADATTDLSNPNVVRSSKGAVFTVPVAEAGSEETISWLQLLGLQIVAALPDGEDEFTEVDLTPPTAIAIGSERHGLSALWQDAAHHRVRIPMKGTVNSLNAATAAALLIYEAVRQRKGAGRSARYDEG